jgi:fructose-1,6-bisphosphatase/inositol monophosphatase family enzyme
MIDILLNFVKQAGKYLTTPRQEVKPLLNKTNSVESLVTSADIHISDLFAETIKHHFSHLNYIIIDEETIAKASDNIFEQINNTEYQFVIDPIDGTLQYAFNHALYGITIGVYKKAEPLLGIIYLPKINELIYYDGKKAYWVQNAFLKTEHKAELLPQSRSSSPIIFGHQWLWNLADNFSISNAIFLDYYSAVSQSFYPLIGKAKAYAMKVNLWDIAGTIPIADYLGLKIYEYGSTKCCNTISAEHFNTKMGMKEPHILCHQEDYAEVCSLITPKKSNI